MKLIIPMAGRGTRLRPHSHVTPKPLMAVRGKSMIERIVETFNHVLPHPLDEGAFVLGPDFGAEIRRQLAEIGERHGMQVHFPVQEEALGTAHAVAAAADYLQGEGLVVYADTVFDMDPGVDLEGADVVMWVKEVDDPRRFGVVNRDAEGHIVGLEEKPTEPTSNEALIGIFYVKDLTQLHRAIDYLFKHNIRGKSGIRGKEGEFFLTHAFDRMIQDGLVFKTATVNAWLDCGTNAALMATTRHLLDAERQETHQGEVIDSFILDPVYIGPGVRVINSIVGPYVSLEEGAKVVHSVVRDSILFSHACVENVVLKDSFVGAHAKVCEPAHTINVGDHSVLG